MRSELNRLLQQLDAADAAPLEQRLRFGLVCAQRVAHLIEQAEVLDCLRQFEAALAAPQAQGSLSELAARADRLANQHQGSRSLDGVGHAAVSATYALAKAIAGKARQAAEYAAYAAVYGQGGYGATSDPDAFVPEYEWQLGQWQHLHAELAA